MSKAFWEGFWQGYVKTSVFMLPWVLFAIVVWVLATYSHPYEECKRMYDTQEDVSECIWIKENP
jgi:ATP/ADP translocase